MPKWHKDFTRVCPDAHIVLVGNKVDVKERKVKAKQIVFHRKKNIQYYDVSAKSNYQYEKPFLHLLRKISGDQELTLVEAPTLQTAEVEITEDQKAQMAAELDEAANAEFPDDE